MFACCPEDLAAATALADERAEDYRDTALDASAFLLGALRTALGNTSALVAAEEEWHRIAKTILG